MSFSYVQCGDCVNEDGSPKRWRWLCADCADDFAARHRTQFGHSHVEVAVVTDDDFVPKAVNMIKRIGW